MKTTQDFVGLEISDLQKEIAKMQKKFFQTKIKIAAAQEKDTAKARKLRREIARAQTILTAKRREISLKNNPTVRQPKSQRCKKIFRGCKKRF
jgi:ribosomal protein L29